MFEIFATQQVSWKGDYIAIQKTNKKDVVPQVIVDEEFAWKIALSDKNEHFTK